MQQFNALLFTPIEGQNVGQILDMNSAMEVDKSSTEISTKIQHLNPNIGNRGKELKASRVSIEDQKIMC